MRIALQIALTVIALALVGCNKKNDKIIFPDGLQTYSVTDSLPFTYEWFLAEKKLVVATTSLYIFSMPFMDIVEDSGDLPVIIYISVEDKEEIIETLKQYNFNYPFVHDPDSLFLQNNDLRKRLGYSDRNTLFPIFMKGDEIYEPAQIGMRDLLKDQLSKFLDK